MNLELQHLYSNFTHSHRVKDGEPQADLTVENITSIPNLIDEQKTRENTNVQV